MRKFILLLKYVGLYYVSGTLILFAVSKFFGAQFQEVYFLKYIPLGELSNRQLAWAFFGRAYAYTLCIGLVEFLAAGLMLFERTRLVGLLLAVGIYANVVVIDRVYEVNDAIQHATIELIIVLVWLFGYVKDLKRIFWDRSGPPLQHEPRPTARFGIYLSVGFLLCSSGYALYRYRARSVPPVGVIGAYKVMGLSVDSQRLALGPGEYTKAPMIFFEYKHDVVLSASDSTYQGTYAVEGDSVLVTFQQEFKGIRSLRASFQEDGLLVGWTNKGQRIKVSMERMKEYPAHTRISL